MSRLACCHWLVVVAMLTGASTALHAQTPAPTRNSPTDSLATVRVIVRQGDAPVEGAIVRALELTPPVGAQTNAEGGATLRLPAGERRLVVSRLGARPDTLALALRVRQDTSIVAQLREQELALEAVIVSATRGERRVEDTPLRVEVVDQEEVNEKLAMRPASIQMLLAETGGLRVQSTSPSIGAANVRVQGLRGRYALLLTDGLPLAGEGEDSRFCRRPSTSRAWRSSRARQDCIARGSAA